MIPDPLHLAAAVIGAFCGYLVFRRAWARPWSHDFVSASDELAARIARSAPAVMRQTQLSGEDLAAVEAFYTRWLNLPREDREAHGETLRGEGLDMVRLGDSLRSYRDRR